MLGVHYELVERLGGKKVSDNKAIVGENAFVVQTTGVHADGDKKTSSP